MQNTQVETALEVGRFQVTQQGQDFSLYKDGVLVECKGRKEILSNKKDWKGMTMAYTIASMLLESWLNKKDNLVTTNVKG